MNITDELRKFMRGADGYELWCPRHKAELLEIADRIDAEHESACAEAYGNGVKLVALPDMTAYVKLPLDANGEYIHVGDVMEWCDSGDTLEVIGIGDDTLFYVDPEGDRTYAEWTAARNKRHHREPTVEDVLREMLDAWGELPSNATNEAIIAEYATKLQLKEDE